MLKKIIALFVIFAMLFPFSTVVAADEPSAQPTVEEILNEYHRKSFEARQAQENGTASAYSRSASGSDTSLEDETIEQLTEAGYEAYHVTENNFEELESVLKTDFSIMGMDPNYGYVIVIEGESNNGAASVSSDLLLPPHVWDDQTPEGGEYFTYTHSGQSFFMRFVTITSADDIRQKKSYIYSFNSNDSAGYGEVILNGVLWYAAGNVFGVFADIASILANCNVNSNQLSLGTNGSFVHATSAWTYNYIEVYDSYDDRWCPSQLSTYANTCVDFHAEFYSEITDCYETTKIHSAYFYTYSPHYFDLDIRKENALIAYFHIPPWRDLTGDITIYYSIEENFSINDVRTYLFVIPQPTHYEY